MGDKMNKKGFTLVELLAVIAVLGIVMGIVLITTSSGFGDAKEKTEQAFIETIKDAADIYLDSSDAREKNFSSLGCTITKTHGNVKIYKANITLNDIINSELKPITKEDLVNPNNKDVECNINARVSIYRDDDYVYYYMIDKSSLNCLNRCDTQDNECIDGYKFGKYITNLPEKFIDKGCM